MSYQTGSATDLDDLMNKMNTFITGTPGWTNNLFNATNRRAVWSRGGSPEPVSRLFQFQWDNTNGWLGMAMIGGYVGDVTWENQTSCEFSSSSYLPSYRHCNMMTGPFPSYYFFEDDYYFHAVVEISTGIYRHFGFGQAALSGTLQGGAYMYAHYWEQSASYIDNPMAQSHYAHFGSYSTSGGSHRSAGLHAIGYPTPYDPNTKYWALGGGYTLTDDDGDNKGPMFAAGWRSGPLVHMFSLRKSDLNDYKPLRPITLFLANTQPTLKQYMLAAHIPDTRSINLYGITPGEEIAVGADVWKCFPITRKGNNGLSYEQEQSWDFGLAYKKVTT